MTRSQLLRPEAPVSHAWGPLAARLREGELAVPAPETPDAGSAGQADTVVTGLALDSRQVMPGEVYFALPGAKTHGARFAAMACSRGAAAIVTDEAGAKLVQQEVLDGVQDLVGVPVLEVRDPRKAAAACAQALFGTAPERVEASGLRSFGVTGTNGKTTTTFFIRSLLEALGNQVGLIGTIELSDSRARQDSVLTTPEAIDVHGLLARMLERGADAMVMEVSSHALEFERVAGLCFDVAGFTNLTQDHLDLHGSMDEYFAVKARLFTPAQARLGVVNVDDAWGARLAEASPIPVRTLSVGAGMGEARTDTDYRVSGLAPERLGYAFEMCLPGKEKPLRITVGTPGLFNVENAAMAVAMVHASGVDGAQLQRALDTRPFESGVPGRMEVVGDSPVAVVDFAHNPDAMERALGALTERTDGKVIIVFGATGERDASKRPIMARTAAAGADIVVVTDDDPHDEDPAAIRADVLRGLEDAPGVLDGTVEYREVAPREKAIAFAAERAQPSDVILVAGRGHESIQEIAGVPHELDDRIALREALAHAQQKRGEHA